MNNNKYFISIAVYLDYFSDATEVQKIIKELSTQVKTVSFEIILCDGGVSTNNKNWVNLFVNSFANSCKYIKSSSLMWKNKFWNESIKIAEGKFIFFYYPKINIKPDFFTTISSKCKDYENIDLIAFESNFEKINFLKNNSNIVNKEQKDTYISWKSNPNFLSNNFFSLQNFVFNRTFLVKNSLSFVEKENFYLLFAHKAIYFSKNILVIKTKLIEDLFVNDYHSLLNLLNQWSEILLLWKKEMTQNRNLKQVINYNYLLYSLTVFPIICILNSNSNNAIEYIKTTQGLIKRENIDYLHNEYFKVNKEAKELIKKITHLDSERIYQFLKKKISL